MGREGNLDEHRLGEEERVLLAAAVGGVLVLEVLEAEREVEDHARAEDLLALAVELEGALAELEARREAAALGQVRLEVRRLGLG